MPVRVCSNQVITFVYETAARNGSVIVFVDPGPRLLVTNQGFHHIFFSIPSPCLFLLVTRGVVICDTICLPNVMFLLEVDYLFLSQHKQPPIYMKEISMHAFQ